MRPTARRDIRYAIHDLLNCRAARDALAAHCARLREAVHDVVGKQYVHVRQHDIGTCVYCDLERALSATPASSLAEHDARVRAVGIKAAAEWLRSTVSEAARAHDFMDQQQGGGCGCSECAHARYLASTADAMVRDA